MSSSKRLQPVVKLARQGMDDAARDLAAGRQKLVLYQAQLDELLSYRDEYRCRLQQLGPDGLSAHQMKDFTVFMARLDQAIEQQQAVLEASRADLETSRQIWLDKQNRAKTIGKIVDRHQHRETQEITRREQRESDERALRSTSGKPGLLELFLKQTGSD